MTKRYRLYSTKKNKVTKRESKIMMVGQALIFFLLDVGLVLKEIYPAPPYR